MQLEIPSSAFEPTDFLETSYVRSFDECEKAYIDYIEHVAQLLVSAGITKYPELKNVTTSDGLPVLDIIIEAIDKTDLASGAFYNNSTREEALQKLHTGYPLRIERKMRKKYIEECLTRDLWNALNLYSRAEQNKRKRSIMKRIMDVFRR